MTEKTSRRSFFVDGFNRLAGWWLLLAGGSALAGCGPDVTTMYGGPPDQNDAGEPVAKYGGPPADGGEADTGPTTKDGSSPLDAG